MSTSTLDHPDAESAREHLGSIALRLVAVTARAAASCCAWIGGGDKLAADRAAVEVMRQALRQVPGRGVVVIGEGEKDQAPMLWAGEDIGTGVGPEFDLAVDPLEGTNLCARGAPGAITVLGVAPRGTMAPLSGFYMEKLVVGADARRAIEPEAPIEENLRRIAVAKRARVHDLRAAVLTRPRHEDLIRRIRATGAGVIEIQDGDVMAAVGALVPDGGVDLSVGIGGAPEGVITACIVKALGGEILGRLAPQSDREQQVVAEAGQLGRRYTTDDLVQSDGCVFVASGVTSTPALPGVVATDRGWVVHTVLASAELGLIRLRSEVRSEDMNEEVSVR